MSTCEFAVLRVEHFHGFHRPLREEHQFTHQSQCKPCIPRPGPGKELHTHITCECTKAGAEVFMRVLDPSCVCVCAHDLCLMLRGWVGRRVGVRVNK